MDSLGHLPVMDREDEVTMILSAEQKQLRYQRRSALLSGLLAPDQSARVSSALEELIDHREQRQARQTLDLSALMRQEREQESAQQPQSAEPPRVPVPESARREQPAHARYSR